MNKSFKNWTFLAGSDFITQISGFIITIKLTQTLSTSQYGVFNVVLALSSIFAVFANFGMAQVIIRSIARKPEYTEKFLRKVVFIRTFSVLATILIALIYQRVLEGHDLLKMIAVTVLLFSLTLWDFVESVAFGKKNTKISSSVNIFSTLIWLLFVFFLPVEYYTMFNILIIYCSIIFIKSASLFLIAYNSGVFKNSGDITEKNSVENVNLLRESLPYLWLWGIGVFANQVPIILLESRAGLEQVAFYSVGAKLVLPVTMVISTILKSVFPTFSELAHSDRDKFSSLILTIFTYIIIAGSVVAFAATILSQYVIPPVFGKEYILSVDSFNYLIWFGVMYSIDLLIGSSLSASDKQNMLAKLATVDILIGFPLMYFGSEYGATGLALSKLVHIMISMTYHWYFVYKLISMRISIKNIALIYSFLIFSFFISIINSVDLSYRIALYIVFIIGFYLLKDSPLKATVTNAKSLLIGNVSNLSSK